MKLRHLAVAVLLVLTASAAVKGYALYGAKWAGAEVPFYVDPSNSDGIPEDVALADIRAAAMAWTAQSGASVSMYYAGRSSGKTVSNNRKNEVFFRDASKNSAAATTYYWMEGNKMVDADIVIWDATYTFVAADAPCSGGIYLLDVMTHEFGHALGIAHSAVGSATMYPSIGWCSSSMRWLDPDDLDAIESLYPPAGANTAPTVAITDPTNASSFPEGTAIPFAGSASDREDGNLGASISWSSSRDGQMGVGASLQKVLSVGSHTITASVVDSRGASSQSQHTVNVEPAASVPPPPPSSGIALSGRGYKVKGAQSVDLTWSGASAANVDVYRDGVLVGTPWNAGAYTDRINKKGGGTYVYRVCEAGTTSCSNDLRIVF